MSFWMILLVAGVVLLLGSCVYILIQVHRLPFVAKVSNKALSWFIAAIPLLVIAGFALFSPVNTFIIVLHLALIWALCNLIARLTKRSQKRFVPALIAVLITAVYFTYGWFACNTVSETDYTVSTGKDASLRVAQISDVHLGTTFNGAGFAQHLADIQEAHPDVLVITGDFVDDASSSEDIFVTSEALGQFESTYGVYFIYGNHDKMHYFSGSREETLANALQQNGVIILEDEVAELGSDAYLIGRKDAGTKTRASMEQLTEGLDTSRYIIVLDHRPTSYEEESLSEADLVLSGHVHGGQLFPIGPLSVAFGINDAYWGLEERNGTCFICNSGISNWSLRFKTFTYSEYAIIDIQAA